MPSSPNFGNQFEEHFKEYLEMICLAGLRFRSRCLVGTRYGRRSVRCLGSSPWGWSEIRMMMDGWRAKSDPVINSIKLLLEFPLSPIKPPWPHLPTHSLIIEDTIQTRAAVFILNSQRPSFRKIILPYREFCMMGSVLDWSIMILCFKM